MPAKRTKTSIYASPARRPALRARKRQKTGHSGSSLAQRLDSDGDDHDAADRTDSDYEDLLEHERAHAHEPGRQRRARRSAPVAGAGSGASSSSRATSTRRSSLASLGGSGGGAAGSAARRGAYRTGKEDSGATVTQHRTRGARTQQPLSPLPVNHAVERQARAATAKGKERARDEDDVAMLPTAPRRAAVQPAHEGSRVTRRTSSGSAHVEMVPPRPRRRASWATTEAGSEDEDEDAHGASDDDVPSCARLRRKPELEDISDAGEAADAEGDRGESPEASDAVEGNDTETKLQEWDAHHLEALLKSELLDLYHLAYPASSSSHSAPRTKAELAHAIVEARDHVPSSEGESDEGADDDDSPHPRTSHEGSPADVSDARRNRRTSGDGQTKASRKKVVLRRSGVRGQEPTPPPSDGSRDGDASGAATEVDESASAAEAGPIATRMTRRASQVEMPPPPLPPAGGRRHMRTRSSTSDALPLSRPGSKKIPSAGSPRARVREVLAEAAEDGGATPVAHRTRHYGQAHGSPPRAGFLAAGSPRPPRAAKRRAVARIVKGDHQGSDGSDAEAAEEEDDEMADDADVLVLGDSDSDDVLDYEGDSSIEFIDAPSLPAPRQAKKAAGTNGRRRSARSAKQVETPPSDADEESGGDTERGAGEEEEEHVEARSHLRQAGRVPRHGRPVKLQRGKERAVEDADEDEKMGEVDDDDEDGEGDETFRLEDLEEVEHDDDGVDLANATSTTLMRYKKDDLVRLCKERDLVDYENRTKPQLVDALLQWRDKTSEMSSPVSSPQSSSSTISNLSTKTAREETKTQALRAIEHASARTSAGTPLLMRPNHSASPAKPHTPEHSKEHERQEDVNALDLESLQLRDKEIQPEELTKLERVGSGGFKDVYKGILDGRTIAICDIRGHSTDMDIKELGLLRDLRHRNIVKFIGVSIPKPPSPVPVMIVTELCANGDLFDYIRKVAPPPFASMLEIMLGISRGIEYLHRRKPNIIHRDIKSSNVLITGEGVPKIADFGLARIKTSTKSMIRSLVGTVNWQAPELWSPHPRYNEKVDVYSVALVFWEILQWHQPVKRYPFEGQNEHAIYHDVGAKQLRPPAGPLRRQWGSEIIDLMSQMWDQDPAQRPSMTQVVAELQRLISGEKAKERAARRG